MWSMSLRGGCRVFMSKTRHPPLGDILVLVVMLLCCGRGTRRKKDVR